MDLIPIAIADRMLALARREALWRGILIGVAVAIVLVALLLPVAGRAQPVPDEARAYQRDLTRAARNVWGVQAPVSTFAAQIHQESRWRADARSPVGASGIAQFMPSTARWIAGVYPAELDGDFASPQWGIRALVRYNRFLWDRTTAIDDCERIAFVLAGYNGGEGWVRKRQALSASPQVCLFATCEINPGITAANQRENSGYPKRILLTLEPIYVAEGFGPGACSR